MNVQQLIALNDRLRANASGMQNLWRQTGAMCLTRKLSSLITASSSSTTNDSNQTTAPDTKLLNSVAVEANQTLAAGLMSWVMPFEGRWFQYEPAPQQKDNEAMKEWLNVCTDIAINELRRSNFYTAIHEVLLDRSTYGTAVLWASKGKDVSWRPSVSLNFRAWDAGSYAIGEDDEGFVDTIPREFELSAAQAEEMFGRDVLPPVVKSELSANRLDTRERYLHFIMPRSEADRKGKEGQAAMPIRSVYIHAPSKTILRDSGFEEIPAIATRHLRWSEASAYGSSPAMQALAEIRGVNYLELLMSTLAETQVNPRLILPQGYEGTPDLRAGGITFGGMTRDTWPQEWMTQGRIDFGMQFIERKEQAIKNAFHNKMFDAFGQLKGDPNIPHIMELKAEQLGRISPSFTLLTTEVINPVLARVFMILLRAGKFPQAPREAFVADSLGQSGFFLPSAVQTNRMSQEMQQAKQGRFAQVFQAFAMMAQAGRPEVLDNLDADKTGRNLMNESGLGELLVPVDARDSLRQQRAAAMQAQQQQAMLLEAAKNPELVKQAAGALGGEAA